MTNLASFPKDLSHSLIFSMVARQNLGVARECGYNKPSMEELASVLRILTMDSSIAAVADTVVNGSCPRILKENTFTTTWHFTYLIARFFSLNTSSDSGQSKFCQTDSRHYISAKMKLLF